MLKHTLHTLDSGLTLLQIPMASVQSATVLVFSNTGSRYEQPQQFGIAHFLEHMVFKGTQQFESSLELASAVDGVGANFNAFTSKEYTGYYVSAAARHLELAMDVVSDMLLTPRLRQEDIDREKGVIIEEMNMYADMPARYIANLFEVLIFKGSGLEHDILGEKNTVTSFTTQDFQEFLNQWYGHRNLVVVVAGDATVVGTPKVEALVKKLFSKGDLKGRGGENKEIATLVKSPFSEHRFHLEQRATEQAHFLIGWEGIKRTSPERYALNLLHTILGGNMSSRLFTEVREKRGLCYYVHSDIDYYHDGGVFGASAGVDPKRVEEALAVTLAEFYAIADGSKPITEAEVAKAKEYTAGKLVLGLEDSESVAQYFGMQQLLRGEIELPDVVIEKTRAVTREQIQELAQKIIHPGRVKLALIGPYQDSAPFQKLIG